MLDLLQDEGAHLDGYFLCPHATPEYVSQKPDTGFYPHLVHDCQCLKPRLGMVFNALKAQGVTPDNADIYVIGDRASDVQSALNLGGTGILIPFVNEPGELDKVRSLAGQGRGQVYIAGTMFVAAEYIFPVLGMIEAAEM
ncbi:MAG: HAD hydrolase-like protein [Desulfurivibrionaceae bacterium]